MTALRDPRTVAAGVYRYPFSGGESRPDFLRRECLFMNPKFILVKSRFPVWNAALEV